MEEKFISKEFIPTEFFHTFNRGVEKRKIFLDEQDYYRGVHDIYEFNDTNTSVNVKRRFINGNLIDGGRTSINRKPRNLLIDCISWCLMPNHYHFFSRPRVKNGLSKFHQKFGTGFTGYFNLKYNRSGVLFQGGYKKVRVETDAQLGYLVCYIHSNILDTWKPNWKEKGLNNFELQNALNFLEDKKNRWSSHQDYLGIKNFPSLISTEFLFKFFGGPQDYRNYFTDWLKQYEKNIKYIKKLVLED